MQKDVTYTWSTNQEKAFNIIKKELMEAPTLQFYDQRKELHLENDASEFGIASVLSQEGKPIAYTSINLTETERNYFQIEQELLAIINGFQKFHHYTYGRATTVTTDHKHLVAVNNKPIGNAPYIIRNLMTKGQMYDYTIIYKPGKELLVEYTLSRSPV